MTMAIKHGVLKDHLSAWLKAKGHRKERAGINAFVSQAISIHPKSVPRAFRRLQLKGADPRKRSGRPCIYTPDTIAALMEVWEVGDHSCGELLHPMIGEYVAILKRDGEWHHTDQATTKLLGMSLMSVKRHTLSLQKKHGLRRGISTTKGGVLKPTIPIFKGPWKDLPPGNGQVDTVAHCGSSASGDYVFTVNYTDAATYWVIARAQWNKGQAATKESLAAIRSLLPFPMKMLHPDTGSEFINWNLKTWCDQEHIGFTRSEPGKKNDNMYVEERNGHVVRRYLGYMRYDAQGVENDLNAFYGVLFIYLNLFKAVRRCLSKERVGAKYVRRYEKQAQTPYRRVLEHPAVAPEMKARLEAEHKTLNPLHLKQQMAILLERAYKQQTAARKRGMAPSGSR